MLVKGVESCTNKILHPWLKQELAAIVQSLAITVEILALLTTQQLWQEWLMNLTVKFTLPQVLPPLRMLLVCDNLAGHKTPEFVLWLCEQGILPLYTPLGGSWLNMAESIQRRNVEPCQDNILKNLSKSSLGLKKFLRYGISIQLLLSGEENALLRQRERLRQQHRLGGSGACTSSPIPKGYADNNGYNRSK